MKKTLLFVLPALLALAAYLAFWPVPIEPRAWTPPPAPALAGQYAANDKLKAIERLADGVGPGPEGIAVDAPGRVYAGYADGRVLEFSAEGQLLRELVNTGGRPLGLTFGPLGGIVAADAKKGLLLIGGTGYVQQLATAAEGVPLGFTDDADNARFDKNVYFTDASSKFGYPNHMADALEHGANGRLLRHDVESHQTTVLARDLHFANGVAVGPDDAYVLVNETWKYRVLRHWLKGEKAGQTEVFIDNLPGFPDNISFNGRDRFWLALYSPRIADLDRLLPSPALRKVVYRLPNFLQPKPAKHAFVLGLDLDGKVVANLQYRADDAYAPITSVEEHGDWLYFGSLTDTAIGRMPLAKAGR